MQVEAPEHKLDEIRKRDRKQMDLIKQRNKLREVQQRIFDYHTE
jgi:hypothetical protein